MVPRLLQSGTVALASGHCLTAVALCIAFAGPACPQEALPAQTPPEHEVKLLTDAYAIAEAYSASPIDPEQAFYQGAIPGLLRRLDPHSVFLDPAQFQQLKQMQQSTTKGFGSVVSILPGRVIVLQTLPGTPSAKSGISPGDEILAINNLRLDRLNLDQLVEVLGEARQKPARLDVRRTGNVRLLQFTLTPEEMQAPSVERAFLLAPRIAYIRIGSFDENTAADLKVAIEAQGGATLQALVLDLRNNPGGLVGAALDTAALFLQPDQTVLTIRGRNVKESVEKVPADAHAYAFPLAILLNEKSASASEIVSGALQDHDRAVIVGEPSYGKGLVQNVFPLSNATGIALTTALYYTPSGRSIQKALRDHGEEFALTQTTAHPNTRQDFKSDKGRPLLGGGGIIPDIAAQPEPTTRLRAALEGSGSFPQFATEFLRTHQVTASFEVTPQLLDTLQSWLSDHQIQPSVNEWSRERPFIEARLKTEIFNQALGVEKGDEIEAQRDPVIQTAIKALGTGTDSTHQ